MYPSDTNPFYGIFVKDQVESLRKEGVSTDVFFINGAKNRWNYFTCLLRLVKTLKNKHYDIIHAHHSYCIFPAIIANAFHGRKLPLILTFHEGEVHFENNFSMNDVDFLKRLVFSKKLKLIALRKTTLVIAVEKKMIDKLNFKGKYTVLPCGVDSDLFKPMDKIWCRKKLNLPLNQKVVFFPASPLNKQKGLDLVKEAIKSLKDGDILLTTGGNIIHEDMPYHMNAADVIVQLSFYEASPSVLKEAMAVNTPMVFTDTGDSALVAGNTYGYFLSDRNPEDVAHKLKKALRMKDRCNGRNRIFESNFTLRAVSKELIGIYEMMTT
jgi:glycosyltransferase involved in cell wall biosynthesis